MANQRHQIAKEWAELKSAKDSIFDMMKPEAFAQHEDNLRQAAGESLIRNNYFLFVSQSVGGGGQGNEA